MENIQLFTEREVSELLRIPLQTLRNNRSIKKHLPYHKIGRSVRYSEKDIVEYLDNHRISTEMWDTYEGGK
jgi:hypothetical protein